MLFLMSRPQADVHMFFSMHVSHKYYVTNQSKGTEKLFHNNTTPAES